MRPLALHILRFALFFLISLPAWAEVAVPALTARVVDQTNTLDASRSALLEAKLAALEQEKGSQVAVLLVPTTQPETIEQFAIRVAEAWQLGRQDVDDGVLLVLAKEDRAVRIEVGYGLEGAVSDILAKRIIEEIMLPRFRQGDFAGGIEAGVDRIAGLIRGEPLPEPEHVGPSGTAVDDLIPFLVLGAFVGGGILRALFGRLPGALAASGIGFVAVWWLLGTVVMALIFAFFIFIMTLGGGRGGGGGGGWSSGGGGGGGFSGGGGGFGGGGASGRW